MDRRIKRPMIVKAKQLPKLFNQNFVNFRGVSDTLKLAGPKL